MNKKRTLHIVTACLVVFVMLFSVAVGVVVITNNKMKTYEKQIADLNDTIAGQKKFVYVAKQDIVAGTVVDDTMVDVQAQVTALSSDSYMQYEDLGKMLTVDVKAGQPVMANTLSDEIFQNDTRVVEIGVATLMLDQKENDFVDIRIMFPDGSDYLVLSKVKVRLLSLENNIFYGALTEDEIITLSSATIDAFTITGTKLYITKYIVPSLQEDGIPNYPIRQETLNLMSSDPNILTRAQETLNAKARAELEQRLSLLTEEQLEAVNAGHGLTDTAHDTAYVDQTQTDPSMIEGTDDESGTEDSTVDDENNEDIEE